MKKNVLKVLIVLWMFMIFMFSNQPGSESTRVSDGFISRTIGNVYRVFHKDVSSDDLVLIQQQYTHFIRKMAHFSLYMILGILVFSLFNEYNFRYLILYSLLFCILYAISDEVHQLFVVGRTGQVFDVLIDSCGSFSGILLFSVLNKINFRY